MRNLLILLFIWLINFSGTRPGPEEGMYPLSELKKLDFKKTGLKLSATDLFNPDGVSLLDALVRLGGCTGSFVSKEGLIVSNHHCVYGSVAEVSTVEKDYLKNGFHAKMKAEELKTKLTLKITANYEDISAKILEKVKDITNPSIRVDSIRAAMKAMEKEASAKDTSSLYEVSEMFPGKSYVLFKYKTIRDIRLVYVPPITIGNFGGESDNWVWPRHTGDFAFVRAYVGPDGNPAEYSEKNIPYTPANFLKIATKGSEENDAVFILGYPGRTYRHFPSAYLEYQEKFVLPYISKLYDWLIEGMELEGKDHPKRALEYANRIKSLANVTQKL